MLCDLHTRTPALTSTFQWRGRHSSKPVVLDREAGDNLPPALELTMSFILRAAVHLGLSGLCLLLDLVPAVSARLHAAKV